MLLKKKSFKIIETEFSKYHFCKIIDFLVILSFKLITEDFASFFSKNYRSILFNQIVNFFVKILKINLFFIQIGFIFSFVESYLKTPIENFY